MLSEDAIHLLEWFDRGEYLFGKDQEVFVKAFRELEHGKLIFLPEPKKIGRHSVIVVHLTERGRGVLVESRKKEK